MIDLLQMLRRVEEKDPKIELKYPEKPRMYPQLHLKALVGEQVFEPLTLWVVTDRLDHQQIYISLFDPTWSAPEQAVEEANKVIEENIPHIARQRQGRWQIYTVDIAKQKQTKPILGAIEKYLEKAIEELQKIAT